MELLTKHFIFTLKLYMSKYRKPKTKTKNEFETFKIYLSIFDFERIFREHIKLMIELT